MPPAPRQSDSTPEPDRAANADGRPELCLNKRDPTAVLVVAAWRRLTGGRKRRDTQRRTLVACSGGADSSALALALAAAEAPGLALAHVLHDLRPAEEAGIDRDRAAELAKRLALPFFEASVAVRATLPRGGNAEAHARTLRYEALLRLAERAGCEYIATAHHADDQLETLLMRLLRGTGSAGLRGIAARRRLIGGITVIRPCLAVTHAQCVDLCRRAGWMWAEDASNSDAARTRNRLRRDVLPVLRELQPRVAQLAVRIARTQDDLHHAARALVDDVLEDAEPGPDGVPEWSRTRLREERPWILAETLRATIAEIYGGRARDRITAQALRAAVRAIRTTDGTNKTLRIGPAQVVMTTHRVRVMPVLPLQ